MDVETSTVAPGEAAEREIDRFVERRAQRAGADAANALEAVWAASERQEQAKRREENRAAWMEHYRRLAASSIKAARDYRRRARELAES